MLSQAIKIVLFSKSNRKNCFASRSERNFKRLILSHGYSDFIHPGDTVTLGSRGIIQNQVWLAKAQPSLAP